MNDSDTFIKKLKNTLDDTPLEQDTRQQLNQARHVALQDQHRSTRSSYRLAAVAFASLVALTLGVLVSIQSPDNPTSLEHLDAFEIITSQDELEMYENLEFYLWLEDQPMEQV